MQRSSRPIALRLVTPPFAVAVLVLAVAAVLAGPVTHWMKITLTKLALPLKSPLSKLDARRLEPYEVSYRHRLEPAVVDSLGTDQYLHWLLEDTSVPPLHPLRHAVLFVTYYSGGRDRVPHTPDVCQLASGYQPAEPHENLEVDFVSPQSSLAKLPIRVCTFMKTDVHSRARHTVIYTFSCNGQFVATRTGVRLLISNLANTYAYFSKVEVSFPNATREQSVAGARKLLERVLPLLIRDHWPDFETAEAAARE